MSLHVRDGGTWKTVDAQDFWVRDAGIWKVIQEGYVRDGGSWKSFYKRSDPITLNYYPTWTHGYMSSNGGKCWGSVLSGVLDNDLIQGYWETSQGTVPGPSGTWGYVQSAMYFDGLDDQIAIRPVVKSATLRLTLAVGYGGDPKNTNVNLGQLPTKSAVEYSSWSHNHTNLNKQDTGDLFTANGQTKVITLNSAMLAALKVVPGIALHDTADSSTETGKRATRAIFEGASASSSIRPQLSVTLDYI